MRWRAGGDQLRFREECLIAARQQLICVLENDPMMCHEAVGASWVYPLAVDLHVEVEVRTSGWTGLTDVPDYLALGNDTPDVDAWRSSHLMGISRLDASSMLDDGVITVGIRGVVRPNHRAVGGGADGRTLRGTEVDSVVERPVVLGRVPPHPEG